MQHTTYRYNYAVNKSESVDWDSNFSHLADRNLALTLPIDCRLSVHDVRHIFVLINVVYVAHYFLVKKFPRNGKLLVRLW